MFSIWRCTMTKRSALDVDQRLVVYKVTHKLPGNGRRMSSVYGSMLKSSLT